MAKREFTARELEAFRARDARKLRGGVGKDDPVGMVERANRAIANQAAADKRLARTYGPDHPGISNKGRAAADMAKTTRVHTAAFSELDSIDRAAKQFPIRVVKSAMSLQEEGGQSNMPKNYLGWEDEPLGGQPKATPMSRAERAYTKKYGYGGPGIGASKEEVAAYDKKYGPDLSHLAKENATPANAAAIQHTPDARTGKVSGPPSKSTLERIGSGKDEAPTKVNTAAEQKYKDRQAGRDIGSKEKEADIASVRARLAAAEERASEASIRAARAKEGYGGSETPKEGDKVQIMGRVQGAGKKGVVISSHGSFHVVATTKKDLEEGRGQSYHSTDLQKRVPKGESTGGRWTK